MKHALVTGHKGFIGRHFAAELERRGWHVAGCDITDGDDCRDLFANAGFRYDLVIHCAANVGGRARIDGDPLAVAENFAIDSDMFRWAARTGQRKVIYFSSSAAYPVAYQDGESNLPLEEDDQKVSHVLGSPDQTYGWAKLAGEKMAEAARQHGVETFIFRPFSGYGEDQSLDYPFPSFIARAKRRDDPFEVWGDGTACRDWIHVDDIVAGVMAVVEAGYSEGPVNLCTGVATSFNKLAERVTYEAGYSTLLLHFTDRPVGVQYRVGDPTLLHKFYRPRITLENGIRRCFK